MRSEEGSLPCTAVSPCGGPKARRGDPGAEAATSLRIPATEPGRHSGDCGSSDHPRPPRDAKRDRVAQHRVRPSTETGREAGGGPASRRAGRRAPHCRKGRTRPAALPPRPSSPSGRSPEGTCTAALSPHTCPSLGAPF